MRGYESDVPLKLYAIAHGAGFASSVCLALFEAVAKLYSLA